MKNLTIKIKLLLLSFLVTLGFLVVVVIEIHDINELHELGILEKDIKDLNIEMLVLRKHEKDFLARKDIKYLDKFIKTVKEMDLTNKEFKQELIHFDLNTKSADEYNKIIHEYNNIFQELVKTQQVIGLNPKDGLYGSLRSSVHKVQEFAKKANDKNLLSMVYDLRKQEKDFMLRNDKKYLNKFNSKLDKLNSDSKYENMSSLLLLYKSDFNKLVELHEKKGLTSKDGLLGKMRKTIHTADDILKDMTIVVEQAIENKTADIKIFAITFSAIIALIVVLFLLFVSRNISTSLKEFEKGLVGFFSFVNNESKEVLPLNDKNSDEIGSMAKIINKNIRKTQENIEIDRKVIDDTIVVLSEFEQGDLSQRVNVETSNEALQELTLLLNNMGEKIEKNINGILSVLEEYSNSNYLNRVNQEGIKEHLLKLANGVNSLGDSATETLVVRKRNGLTLQSSAVTLKSNVENLSSTANEAAASLEETAAALEEITSTIISNADNVTEMAKYAAKVTKTASSGEELANNTMVSMDEINNQVTSIKDAITVIDQIAFQTNILSLNAAVEAATAGEAGKGFAVVAQEVRNLASRSAEAAKEIKEIVEIATVKANAGKDIAQDMLAGYKELNEGIGKTTDLIKNVDSASKEQQSGIEQINDAVTQIDQQTQKNSSAAMETNDIAITTEKLAETIISGVNRNQFKGKDDVQDRRGDCRDLNYQGDEKRRAEAQIKATSPKRENGTNVEEDDKPREVINKDNLNKSDANEWESF